MTAGGYWGSEGDDELVTSGSNDVGIKKTFVFYTGKAPDRIRTNWVMHEYHLLQGFDGDASATSSSSSRRTSSSKKQGHARAASTLIIIIIIIIYRLAVVC